GGNGVASFVNLSFDRQMNTDTTNGFPAFGPADIVSITGPNGVIYDKAAGIGGPVTVTPVGVTAPTPATTFKIGFPAQILSGSYTFQIDSNFAAAPTIPGGTLTDHNGIVHPVLIDSNLNAGLDVLRGGNPTSGIKTNSSYTASFAGAASTIPAASGNVAGVADFPIAVPDIFAIALSTGHQVSVQLNISDTVSDNTSVVDLVGELIAPDGTVIRLFTNVGNPTRNPPGTLWFSNTLFSDVGNTPIQSGFQPFDSGPYNPQFPLDNLSGLNANGTWTLRILNSGTHTPHLTSWTLSLPQISGGTGLGETNADSFAVSFRIFNQDPTSLLTQDVWTAVGPAPEQYGIAQSARTNAIAVDPSDPSGNTVYIGAASGGLWKTTDFLTTNANGPTWLPLGDGAPAFGLNVVSIAVFPRNNDPRQSTIFALTGEGDTFSPGVGVLRSMDGGKTWVVLDSTNNTSSPANGTGSITSIDDSVHRDRKFFNVTGFKIVVDPTPVNDADNDVIVYMATGSGVWRSNDTGRHLTQMQAGTATDIVLAEGSSATAGTPNRQILYAAIEGSGVFIAQPAFAAGGMVELTGAPPGNGSFIQSDDPLLPRVGISAPSQTPNGAKGRILLATPALTNNRIQDLNYQGWLYALVVAPNNSLDGLYLTKDFGHNWTKVDMSQYLPTAASGFGTNDYTQIDHDPFSAPPGASNPLPGQGNYDVGFAIDPQNPNVVFIGGTNDAAVRVDGEPGDLIRVDTTGVMDALAVVAYDNSSVPTNEIQFTPNSATVGNVTVKVPGGAYGVTDANPTSNIGLL